MNEMRGLEKQKSQSGQALVEYVLLLAIAATLLLGLAAQFYKPFGGWVQNQMGPYLECLLDVGELPSLGGDTSGECAAQFQPFSPGANVASNPPRPVNSNGDGGSNASTQNSQLNPSSANSRGGTTAVVGGSSRGGQKGFPIGGSRGADGSGSSSGEQVIVEKLPESKFMKLRSSSGGSVVVQRGLPAVGIAGVIAQEKLKKQKNENEPVKVGTLEDGDMAGSKSKKILMKPPERKTASADEERPWTFGEYFKFAIILMIIIAIILFLAGQVAQISKSMEK